MSNKQTKAGAPYARQQCCRRSVLLPRPAPELHSEDPPQSVRMESEGVRPNLLCDRTIGQRAFSLRRVSQGAFATQNRSVH